MKHKQSTAVEKRQLAMQKPVEKLAEKPVETPVEELQEKPKSENKQYDYQDIGGAPRNGSLIIVSETGKDLGEAVLWRRTRAFANATSRWEETGFFVSNRSGQKLSFTPKYWRVRGMYEV